MAEKRAACRPAPGL